MMTPSDRVYDLTDNIEIWDIESLLRFGTDAELLLGLEKWQVVKIAQELAYRLMEYTDDS